jgi:hypothetical protein
MAVVPSNAKSAKSGDNVESLLKQQKRQEGNNINDNQEEVNETKIFKATVAPFPLEA